MNELFLLDMSGLGHAMYHASNKELVDADGNPCGMLDRFREWALELLERFEPSHVVAVFDGSKNWRKVRFAEYKAQRKPIDDALKYQLGQLSIEAEHLGIACLRYDEFEADDTLAALCALHASESLPVTIVSSDKDMAQLIGDHVRMFDPRPDKNGQTHIYNAERAAERWGVPPHRMTEYLALVGDASDNVPGVEGWGKVNACNAINQTRSWLELKRKAAGGQLEKIRPELQRSSGLCRSCKQSVRPWPATCGHALAGATCGGSEPPSLIAQLDAFALAHELVSLRYDVPITETLDDLRWRHPSEFSAQAPAFESEAAS